MTAGSDRTIHLWNPRKKGSDDEHASVMERTPSSSPSERNSQVWFCTDESDSYVARFKEGHGYDILDVDCSSTSSSLLSVGGDKQVCCWDVRTVTLKRKFHGHDHRVNRYVNVHLMFWLISHSLSFLTAYTSSLSVRYLPDDTTFVTGSNDQTVRLWDVRTPRAVQIMSDATDSVSSVCISGSRIIATSLDGCVYMYDVRMHQKTADHVGGAAVAVAGTSDGETVVVQTTDNKMILVDLMDGNHLNEYNQHKCHDLNIKLALVNNDQYILTGSEDGNAVLYDFLTTQAVHTLTHPFKFTWGPQDSTTTPPISAVAADPKLNVAVTASHDGSIVVWS